MMSKAANVAEYLEELPEERRPAIRKLRQLCKRNLADYEEIMAYGMPTYRRQGVMEIAFGSQKQHIALYVMKKEVVDEFRG